MWKVSAGGQPNAGVHSDLGQEAGTGRLPGPGQDAGSGEPGNQLVASRRRPGRRDERRRREISVGRGRFRRRSKYKPLWLGCWPRFWLGRDRGLTMRRVRCAEVRDAVPACRAGPLPADDAGKRVGRGHRRGP